MNVLHPCHDEWLMATLVRRYALFLVHAEEGALRLAGGSTSEATGAQFGLVEVFADGGWGRLCTRMEQSNSRAVAAADRDAMVICRQLGFSEGINAVTPVRSHPSVWGLVEDTPRAQPLRCTLTSTLAIYDVKGTVRTAVYVERYSCGLLPCA